MYFSPQKLMSSSISLIHHMLDYPRYRKCGFYAIYCVALMIQDCRSQQDCINNLFPVFSNEPIVKALITAIKDVDIKYCNMKQIEGRSASKGTRDMLEKYEHQTKSNVVAGNKQL